MSRGQGYWVQICKDTELGSGTVQVVPGACRDVGCILSGPLGLGIKPKPLEGEGMIPTSRQIIFCKGLFTFCGALKGDDG